MLVLEHLTRPLDALVPLKHFLRPVARSRFSRGIANRDGVFFYTFFKGTATLA
jgi:hypothetical protein